MTQPRRTIAGWPARLETEWIGARPIRIYTPDRLDERLDRDRLLHDDACVPPYWALLWSGGRELARYLATEVPLAGRSALEVGCGLGLPSLAAAAAGARVTAIDREAPAIDFLRASAAANDIVVEALLGDLEAVAARTFDEVIAAELLYERAAFPSLAEALVRATAAGGRVWVADAERVDTRPFFAELARAGAVLEAEETREVVEEGSRVRVRIRGYRIAITR